MHISYYLYSMRYKTFYSLFLLLLISFTACKLNTEEAPEESLSITLPEWPPQTSRERDWPPLSRWYIKVTTAEGQYLFSTCEKKVNIHIEKNRPFCITSYPITLLKNNSECSFFKPAGCIYPSKTASWEQGFLANTMELLFQEGLDENLPPVDIEYLISTFNWKKAQESIEKKIQSDSRYFYNPWLISQGPLLEGIASHNFKATLLNIKSAAPLDKAFFEVNNLSQEKYFSSFIPENYHSNQKKQFTLIKNTPILISDGQNYGLFITYKSSKNISLEHINLPIFIGDI